MTAELHDMSIERERRLHERVQRWECFLPFPPSTNSLYENRAGGRRKASRYGKWITEAGTELMVLRPPHFLSPVAIDIQLGLPDKRRRDVSNTIKAVEDLLVRHGVIQDDSYEFVPDVRSRIGQDVPPGQVKVCIERVRGG